MKHIYFFVVILSMGLASVTSAQSRLVQAGVTDLKAGPLFTGGGTVNAGDVAGGTKTSPCGAFSGGALFDFSYTSNVGFDLGVVYDARYINFHNAINTAAGVTYSFGYLALRPELRFSGFLIGVGLGLPVGTNAVGSGGAVSPSIATRDMNALFEGRLGGTVELMQSDLGTLNFTAEASYAFSRPIINSWFNGADNTKNNGPLATLEVGINYLFDLMPYHQNEPAAVAISPGQ